MKKQIYSVDEEIVLKWAPYAGASQYSIQLFEKSEPHAFIGNTTSFDWKNRPKVTSNSFSLKAHGVNLKVNHFYVFEVYAQNEESIIISKTPQKYSGYDFEVTE